MNKSNFYKFNTDDIEVNKILISKKESCSKKTHLNTLLDIVIMMTLDLYVQSFPKWLGMLNVLIVIRQ